MYLCYIDESGTPDIPGNSSHYVLAGISIPIEYWRRCDQQVDAIKDRYKLGNTEIHVAWILRPYKEQRQIQNFISMDYGQRRAEVENLRNRELL